MINNKKIIEEYIGEDDWRIKENSNMSYSLQGLNNHIISHSISDYWLNEIYPENIRKAHKDGDVHIHDLSSLSCYCGGWDLKDLLIQGITGVTGKVESAPPKHFRTALGQLVNFMYTMQGEMAGAQAVSSFDTYLAPFIKRDKLSYKEVKQSIQEFVFNMNVPTRVGFQCLAEDTEILTKEGWASYNEIKPGDTILNYNISTEEIEENEVKKLFKRNYSGKMYHLKTRDTDQLISPGHRVVRRMAGGRVVLEEIETTLKAKSPLIIPTRTKGIKQGKKLSAQDTNKALLAAWIISDGIVDRNGRGIGRITITQKRGTLGYRRIHELLKALSFSVYERDNTGFGKSTAIRLTSEDSRTMYDFFDGNKMDGLKYVPNVIKNASKKDISDFIIEYLRGDGNLEEMTTSTIFPGLADDLEELAIKAGYSATRTIRTKLGPFNRHPLHQINFRTVDNIGIRNEQIKEVDYSGIIWCPNTKNETVIARRNGKIFITGNTPFSNLTLDLVPSESVGNENVIIGGEVTSDKYKDFQKEMDMINIAFCDVMMAGDAKGRIFTFPIPTYNITEDFDWDSPVAKKIFEMTSKYGIPYFSNFINSDMSPDDVRSMAILGSQELIYRSNDGRISKWEIRNITRTWLKSPNDNKPRYEVLMNGEFVKIIDMFKVPYDKYDKYVQHKLSNGLTQNFSCQHKCLIIRDGDIQEVESDDVVPGDMAVIAKNGYEGNENIGSESSGLITGYYLAEGWCRDNEVYFAINIKRSDIVNNICSFFNNIGCDVVVNKQEDVNIFRVQVYGKQAVGFVKQYVNGDTAKTKRLDNSIWNTSASFRTGLYTGYVETDGCKHRDVIAHTTNKKLVEDLIILCNSIGIVTKYRENNKNTRYFKKDKRDLETFTSYELKRITPEKYNYDYYGVEIIDVIHLDSKTDTVYNFTVDTEDHLYELPNGIVTNQCCRLRISNKELRKRGGGLFGSNPLTGSIGIVTINLPRLGFLCKSKNELLNSIGCLMDLSRDSLVIKRKVLEEKTNGGLYPYSKHYLKGVYERFGEHWKNHFSTIGIIGMNEMLMNFNGENIGSEAGLDLAKDVLNFMRDKLLEYQKETGDVWNLEATPAEGTTRRLAAMDKKKYNKIIVANNDKYTKDSVAPYYTNSSHLPVNYTDDIFEALDLQDDIQSLYTGGTVLHVFLGESLPSIESVKNLIKKISYNYKLPYFTLTPTFSICPKHGYLAGEHEYCPKCDEENAVEIKKNEKN